MIFYFDNKAWGGNNWENWQSWNWNYSGIPNPNAAVAAALAPGVAATVAVPTTTAAVPSKDGYGYTTGFVDPAVPPATIEYNHGVAGEGAPSSNVRKFLIMFVVFKFCCCNFENFFVDIRLLDGAFRRSCRRLCI